MLALLILSGLNLVGLPASELLAVVQHPVHPVGGGGGAVVTPVWQLDGGFDSSPNWLMKSMCSRCDRLQSMELVPAVTPSI